MAQGAVLRAQHHVPGTERLLAGAAQAQSLVFDLEAEDVQSHRSDDGQVVIDQLHVAISRLCNPQGLFHPKLVQDVTAYKRSVEYEEGKLDTVVLAAKLAGAGYWVRVRKALGGGQDCFRNLRHEFLIIQGREDADGQEFLVEASLREHFRIPHPTPLYETVLNSIPNEFVGSKTMLEHLVNFLCKHMELAFEEQGFTCPPWRRASAMLSKWLPKAHKVSDRVFSGENSPAAGNWGKRPEGLSPSSSMSGDPGCQAMGVSPRALARSINVLRSTAAGLPEGAVTPDTSVESPGLLTGLAAPVRIGFDVH